MEARGIRYLSLAVRATAHLLVDAVCACALYGSDMTLICFLIYDTLAFSTQPVTGMICDKRQNRLSVIASGSCLLLAVAFFLPVGDLTRAVMLGIGNSFFHTSAGTSVLISSDGKAYPQGVFVAPGCIGIALGKLFPQAGTAFACCVAAAAFALLFLPSYAGNPSEKIRQGKQENMSCAMALFAAVAVRAFGGSVVTFSWKKGIAGALLMTAAVFLGKFTGGFAADRSDVRKLSLFSIVSAALLIAFGSDVPALSLAGQFLINLTMPVTLWLMYRSLPDEPGFAFGLAAAALWPGALAGYLVSLTGAWRWICVIICFLAGTAAISYSTVVLEKGDKENE